MNRARWSEEPLPDGGYLDLITPEEFETLPDGTTLVGIYWDFSSLAPHPPNIVVKGRDEIDLDTRGGYIAWGFPCYEEAVCSHIKE